MGCEVAEGGQKCGLIAVNVVKGSIVEVCACVFLCVGKRTVVEVNKRVRYLLLRIDAKSRMMWPKRRSLRRLDQL